MAISKESFEHAIRVAVKQQIESDSFDIQSGILTDSDKNTSYYKFDFVIKYQDNIFKLILEAKEGNLSIISNTDGIYDIVEAHFISSHIIKLNENDFKTRTIIFLNSIPDLTY